MSNPAIAKWLQEIAAAKAKVEAKTTQPIATSQGSDIKINNNNINNPQSQPYSTSSSNVVGSTEKRHPGNTSTTTAADQSNTTPITNYGIITSYNLKTRKKQLQLKLPPEPIKPGPGECCGNDCDPCVNTIYWEDLAAHRKVVEQLKQEYEEACRELESNLVTDSVTATVTKGLSYTSLSNNTTLGPQSIRDTDLNVRSYKPFKILKKQYLSDTTLLVTCDLPYPNPTTPSSPEHKHDHEYDYIKNHMFHVLIRFKIGDQYITKAFTPVDFSKLYPSESNPNNTNSNIGDQSKMGFLVKLYPSPHATSDMFRRLKVHKSNVGNVSTDNSKVSDPNPDLNADPTPISYDDNSNSASKDCAEEGVLYLRGPIQTKRDRLRIQQLNAIQQVDRREQGSSKPHQRLERVVMIAAGSGITPMYQILRAVKFGQHYGYSNHDNNDNNSSSNNNDNSHTFGSRQDNLVVRELDLLYCNRTSSEIWLRQEIRDMTSSKDEIINNPPNSPKRTKIRVQHILSSESITVEDETSNIKCDESDRIVPWSHHQHHHHHQERIHKGGRISLELLKDTLEHKFYGDEMLQEYFQILICGPPSFNSDVEQMLIDLGYVESEKCEIHILE